MLEPLVNTIEVPCGQEQAFRVFVEQMGNWWPLEMFSISAMGGSPAKDIRVDARQGGEIVEIGPDGTEHSWGTISIYDPYALVALDFHIPEPNHYTEGSFTFIEVKFEALSENQTRVELTQDNWEALGDEAPGIRGGYEHGWTVIFEQRYLAACSA